MALFFMNILPHDIGHQRCSRLTGHHPLPCKVAAEIIATQFYGHHIPIPILCFSLWQNGNAMKLRRELQKQKFTYPLIFIFLKLRRKRKRDQCLSVPEKSVPHLQYPCECSQPFLSSPLICHQSNSNPKSSQHYISMREDKADCNFTQKMPNSRIVHSTVISSRIIIKNFGYTKFWTLLFPEPFIVPSNNFIWLMSRQK